MKKPSSKLRAEIAKLEEQLKVSETRDAERIGKVALKAGLGDIEVDETELREAFEDVAKRFRGGKGRANGRERAGEGGTSSTQTSTVSPGTIAGNSGEA